MSSASSNARTYEEIFKEFTARRAGIVRALTTDVDSFYGLCDPEKENLCLYGLPDESWEVNLPAEEVPPLLPEPVRGINFARDRMTKRFWIYLVAVHSDCWLFSVALYLAAGLHPNDRKRLFSLIDDLPTVFDGLALPRRMEYKPGDEIGNKSGGRTKEEVDAMTVRSNGPITRARAKAIAQVTHPMVIRLGRHAEKPDDSPKVAHVSMHSPAEPAG